MKRKRLRVHPAEAWRPNAAGSFGNAAEMIVTQHNFPNTYTKRDVLTGAWSDRCRTWDGDHYEQAMTKAGIRGSQGIPHWAGEATPEQLFAFLQDILKADEHHPEVEWTGYRVCVTVSRANGYAVCMLQLFAKHKETKTKTYTTPANSMFLGTRGMPPNIRLAPDQMPKRRQA